MIAWDPKGEIKVGPWPDYTGWSDDFLFTSGACYRVWHELKTRDAMRAVLFTDFNTIVARDGVDPQKAHDEFLKIDQYRIWISRDMRGAEDED